MKTGTTAQYNEAMIGADRLICDILRGEIEQTLSEADGRIWHAHPVWFFDSNPVVGYSKLKHCIRLLFWSGRLFPTPGLSAEGKFQAAEMRFTNADEIDRQLLRRWLEDARAIQWDYRNIVRRKGRLERLR
jgi:hypothetical protein